MKKLAGLLFVSLSFGCSAGKYVYSPVKISGSMFSGVMSHSKDYSYQEIGCSVDTDLNDGNKYISCYASDIGSENGLCQTQLGQNVTLPELDQNVKLTVRFNKQTAVCEEVVFDYSSKYYAQTAPNPFGYDQPVNVTESRASGVIKSARNSFDNNQFIECSITITPETSAVGAPLSKKRLSCIAEDQKGNAFSCSNQIDSRTIPVFTSNSYIVIRTNSENECTSIVVDKNSRF